MDSRYVLGHKITARQISGDYDMVIGDTPAQVPGPPPHDHKGLDEVFLVTEGEMEFVINGTARTLRAGDSVDLPRGTVHTFMNRSDSKCTWVNIHSPKGFLSFFEDIGILAEEDDAFDRSMDKSVIDRVMETASDYDMHIKC